MDKRKLRTLGVVLYSVLSTFVPLLAVFTPRGGEGMQTWLNATECGVTELQADVIRSVFRNESCGYNVTVHQILAGGYE